MAKTKKAHRRAGPGKPQGMNYAQVLARKAAIQKGLEQAARDAMAGRGWTGQITIVLRAADGFTRNLSYSLDQESARQGVHLVSTKGV